MLKVEYDIDAEWHVYASVNLAITGSDNGLSPDRRQAIIWTSAGISLIGPGLGTYFNEIFSKIQQFSFKKMRLKMSSAMGHQFCLTLHVLRPPLSILPKPT